MVESKFVKKIVKPDGSVKIYEYKKDSMYYYNLRKERNPHIACEICGQMLLPWTLKKHQSRKICKKNRGENIKTIPAPGSENN